MDQMKIAERVVGKVAGKGEEYRKYFEKKLKKWKVKSPSEIPDDKKDEFFEEVDKGWNSEDESGKDGKKASEMTSLRDRMARKRESGCEKLPEGPMRDNCEKKKEEGKKNKEKEAGAGAFEYYATLTFGKNAVKFRIDNGAGGGTSGAQPYRNDPIKAISYVFKLIRKWGVNESDVEVIN